MRLLLLSVLLLIVGPLPAQAPLSKTGDQVPPGVYGRPPTLKGFWPYLAIAIRSRTFHAEYLGSTEVPELNGSAVLTVPRTGEYQAVAYGETIELLVIRSNRLESDSRSLSDLQPGEYRVFSLQTAGDYSVFIMRTSAAPVYDQEHQRIVVSQVISLTGPNVPRSTPQCVVIDLNNHLAVVERK